MNNLSFFGQSSRRLVPTALLSFALLLAALLLVLVGGVSSALATGPAAQSYAEVGRFGAYDPTGETLGKFDQPVGFAVDPSNNEVFVLDRVVDELENEEEEEKLQYRLQELSSTGTLLGSVLLTPEKYERRRSYVNAQPVLSLAVDASKKRVYAVVEGMVESGGSRVVPVAQRIVAWSTEPNSKKELVPASGYKELDPVTGGALVAGASVLEPGTASEDLYAPEGISIDPANHDVVIEAQHGVKEAHGGPTILQRVPAEPSEAGESGEQWISTTPFVPSNEQGDGVFTANDGSFGIDLYEERGAISFLADVKANFKEPLPSRIAEDKSGGANRDEAATIDGGSTVNYNGNVAGQWSNSNVISTLTAGSPVVQLTDGVFASRYGYGAGNDLQAEIGPWNNGGPVEPFWSQGLNTDNVGNEGIRLFEADGSIVDTLGGPEGAACHIENGLVALAAGANGALFVLEQPNVTNEHGDVVVEYSPEGTKACLRPSGTPTVAGVSAAAGTTITVLENEPVEFNAATINRNGEAPFEYGWNFGDGHEEVLALRNDPEDFWPQPTTEHTYHEAKEFEASLKLAGSYGSNEYSFKVKVQGTKVPVAKIANPATAVEGEEVTLSGAGSEPTEGTHISNYHWTFSDGTPPVNTAAAEIKHVFASKGNNTITLTVTDAESKEVSLVAESAISIEEKKSSGSGGGNTGGGSSGTGSTSTGASTGTGTSTTGITPPPPSPVSTASGHSKPLTMTQKLAAAIRECKKQSKRRQAACIRAAKKKYGPKPKPAKRKKK